ncbi:MAG: SWF/SNF helicase family protein, partial [Phycisphaerales bacterium]|nr:SWF/SNF helicase family protein [Phycisphaerales bacterium]
GHIESFASLIDLLEVEAVTWPADGRAPVIEHASAAPHVVQRRRDDIRAWFEEAGERYPFPTRDQDETVVPLGKQEHAVLAALRDYTSGLVRRSSAPINGWVALHLQKRALSSPAALRRSLENRMAALRRKLTEEAGSPSDAEVAVMDEEGGDDLSDEQRFARVDRSALGDPSAELDELERLHGVAKKVTPGRDAKLKHLLDDTIPYAFSRQRNKRVIVFTRYRDTLDYVAAQVRAHAERAQAGQPLFDVLAVEIHGEMNPADRRAALAAFEAADRAVLVATDCISEGMNLQRACGALVHYELPWNPNRLEQRNGRIDRYRQPEPSVTIRTLVCDDPLDFTILNVLVTKARRIREDYGFSPPFFSSSRELLELMRRHGHAPVEQLDLFSQATGSGEDGDAPDLLSRETAERIRSQSFYGHVSVTLEEVQRALTDTARTVGTRDEIERFVTASLAYLSVPVRRIDAGVLEIAVGASTLFADLAPAGLPQLVG